MSLNNINKDVKNSDLSEPDTSGLFCQQPFANLEVNQWGQARTCCAYWMNKSIGNIKTKPIEDVINSEQAQKIRASILDGSFKFCNKMTCPLIQGNCLPKKEDVTDPYYKDIIDNNRTHINTVRYVNFLWDLSCNLECPSCRKMKILNVKGDDYQQSLDIQNSVINYVFNSNTQDEVIFNITGSGDPFGSKIFRDFLIDFDGTKYPHIKINLQTNGVMFTKKMWELMSKCHDNIGTVLVSIDAATEETYDKVRVGGDWKILMSNLDMLSTLRTNNQIDHLRLDFVVQLENYKEMVPAVNLMESFDGVDGIYFSIVTDWASWDRDTFKKQAIWMPDNKYYQDFLNTLKNNIFESSNVELGTLSEFYRKAQQET